MKDGLNISDELLRIQALMRSGEVVAAEQACQTLVQSAASEPRGWFLLGRLQLQRGDARGAEVSLRQAVVLDAGQALYWADLSVALNEIGQATQAEAAAL